MTNQPPRRAAAYFPKSESIYRRREQHDLPERPKEKGPIFNPDISNTTPIDAYDTRTADVVYAEKTAAPNTTALPPQPENFPSRYLFPMLAKNERLRLTMLWYYTRGITEDRDLLQKLQGIVKLVRGFIGWEFVIMGILDNDVYMRLVTDGLPLAILPRRESTCSHTINQQASVFVLPNMIEDWRFKHSPHVEVGGLRSYAGAALRCETENGQKISLGSLCVAANAPTATLSPEKQAALARFADILTAEIVNRCRITRQRQRQIMGDMIAKIKVEANADNVEEIIRKAVQDTYPNARVTFQEVSNDAIHLEDRLPIRFSEVEDGLWEDSEYLELLILMNNHQRLTSKQTVRAIVGRCGRQPRPQYLVVASRDVQLVFDDVDAWFIESCAQIYCNIHQEQLLAEALKAKETFLRGITHQLRTPIHGILGSVELLGEELASRNLARMTAAKDSTEETTLTNTAQLYLQAIENSGRELMSTVNNMLTLNRWAESSRTLKPASLYQLNQLESDILRDISQMLPEDEMANTSILFDNQLGVDCSVITTDIGLLKECLQSLILNAVQSTSHGSVLIITSATDNYSILKFDVIDTGTGISKENQNRIFEAYEKGDTHSRGVGLGLTIASKIATALDGSVFLVSSQVGKGSHFRAEFQNPGFACPHTRTPPLTSAMLSRIPRIFHEVLTDEEANPLVHHFTGFLEHRGYTRSPLSHGSLNIVSYMENEAKFQQILTTVDPSSVSICLIPGRKSAAHLKVPSRFTKLLFFEGPFHSDRLKEILRQVDELCPALMAQPPPGITTNGVPSAPSLDEFSDLFAKTMRISEPPNALLVDDNPINMRIMRMYCEKRKIPYAVATDGNEAIAQFKEYGESKPFNLILMDLQMPNCDGIEACATIRRMEMDLVPRRQQSVIFIITGQDSPEDKSNSLAAGANEFFVKPLSIKALDNGIKQYFGPQASSKDKTSG